jgi:hypothetical protein
MVLLLTMPVLAYIFVCSQLSARLPLSFIVRGGVMNADAMNADATNADAITLGVLLHSCLPCLHLSCSVAASMLIREIRKWPSRCMGLL